MALMGKKSLKLRDKQNSIISCLHTGIIAFEVAIVKTAVLLLLISVFLFSCGDRAPVDREYLKSERYQQFSERQSQEYTLRIENYESLEKYLSEFGQCDLGIKRNYPLQIDNRILEQEFSRCDEVDDKYDSNFTIQNFGYSPFKEITIRWIIVQQESVYENTELFVTTYRNDSLISFQTVGVFRQNLQQDISTNIEVDREDNFIRIQSSMDRGIKYPFNYDNVIQSTYEIDEFGNIKERTEEATSYQSLPKYLDELNCCARGEKWILPLQINSDVLSRVGSSCEQITGNYNTNLTTRSIGYTKINNVIVRLFDMKSHSGNHMLMAATYNDSSLVSFQTVGKFHSYSPGFATDIDISSSITIHQEGDLLYISSSIIRNRSFPIKQENSATVKFKVGTDGNIREI